MKKMSEWLSELPEPYRGQALANFKTFDGGDMELSTRYGAVAAAFPWEDSPQGRKYWESLHDLLYYGNADIIFPLNEVIANLKEKGDDWNANVLEAVVEKLKNR